MNSLSTELHNEWIKPRDKLDGLSLMDHLFNQLDGAFPGRWRSSFPSDQSIQNWKESWIDSFTEINLKPHEVKEGLSACKRLYSWPPSIKEFIDACRPDDSEEAYRMAISIVSRVGSDRNYEDDHVLYWAVSQYGAFDLAQSSWERAKERWCSIYRKCVDAYYRGELPGIPPDIEVLPAPEQTRVSSEKLEKLANESVQAAKIDSRKWAKDLKARHEAGEKLSLIQVDSYQDALRTEE